MKYANIRRFVELGRKIIDIFISESMVSSCFSLIMVGREAYSLLFSTLIAARTLITA